MVEKPRISDAVKYSVNESAFQETLHEMYVHPALQQLKAIPQHKGNTTFAHSVSVAALSYRIATRLHLSINIDCLVRGAMLHDFYLYDTNTMPYSDYRHAIVHPILAVKNAEKYFDLNSRERNIILSHMWPIPGTPLPRCKEAWLVCMADKVCACREMYGKRASHSRNRSRYLCEPRKPL